MLDLDPVLMAIIAVIFLGVVARLNSCLYQPLLRHMEDRDKSIEEKLSQCEQNTQDLQKYYDEANHILAEAKKEAASITHSAISEATAMGEGKFNETKKILEEKLNNVIDSLSKEKESIINRLSGEVSVYRETLINKLKSV